MNIISNILKISIDKILESDIIICKKTYELKIKYLKQKIIKYFDDAYNLHVYKYNSNINIGLNNEFNMIHTKNKSKYNYTNGGYCIWVHIDNNYDIRDAFKLYSYIYKYIYDYNIQSIIYKFNEYKIRFDCYNYNNKKYIQKIILYVGTTYNLNMKYRKFIHYNFNYYIII